MCYISSPYQSHARTADDYCRLLADRYTRVSSIDSKIVFFHIEPHEYEAIYQRYPVLRDKYVIAYCVWEATDLPAAYRRSLSFVNEVWTPSKYCRAIFERYHPVVTLVPHVIHRNTACTERDLAAVRGLLSHREDCYYFLTITKRWDKRKNTAMLLDAFKSVSSKMPNARLIVKDIESEERSLYEESNVIYIQQQLPFTQLNALYRLASCYVSPHHSEAWGLTISDAMLFCKPVIATGYSGNLEYMNSANSILLSYREEFIHSNDHYHLFDDGMKWAYPDAEDLESKLLAAYNSANREATQSLVEKATEDIKCFNGSAVQQVMFRRLDALGL